MPHVCCRDKNAFAMRAMFMGAKINDIKNFLIITGDPVPASARNLVKSVFNFSSVGLMKIAQEMNKEVFNDNPLNYGGAINQNLINLDSVINTTKRKMEAGANFASSPARILIDFKDPLVVAGKIATTDSNKYVTINDIKNELRDGENGVSGIGAQGKKRNI